MPKENIRAYLAWVAICLIWGTTYLAIRIGVHDFPPVLFAGFRWLIAGPILIIILKLRGYKLPALKDIKHLAVVGILLLGFGNGLVVFAEQWVPSGLTALLISTDPLWIVGIESLLPGGPRLNLKIVVGVLLGLAGVILIFGSNLSAILNTQYLVGVIGLMLCVLCWSCGTLYSKYKKVSVHPLMGAAVEMAIAGICLSLLGDNYRRIFKPAFDSKRCIFILVPARIRFLYCIRFIHLCSSKFTGVFRFHLCLHKPYYRIIPGMADTG